MLNQEDIQRMKKAASLELEGLQKLSEAQDLLKGGAMRVEGDPMPVVTEGEPEAEPEEGGMVLMLSDEYKAASLEILESVASELEKSDKEEIRVQAGELRLAAEAVRKNSFVYEKDLVDPEPEVDQFFRDGVVEIPSEDKGKPFAKKLETDDTVEVANFVKNPAPYQKM